MKKEISICLTGHRPNKLDGYNLETTFYQKLQIDLFCFKKLSESDL